MPNYQDSDPGGDGLSGVPDLPLILEQMQNQLDDLRTVVEALQAQLEQQSARLAALERR